MPDFVWPLLTFVFALDEHNLEEAIDLLDQVDGIDNAEFDVVVVARNTDIGADLAGMRGRDVPLVVDAELRRTAGLWIAGGDYVVFLNRSIELTEAGLRSVVAVHDRGTALVALPAADPTPSAAGWAEYFDDPVTYSFAREILKQAGGFDDNAGAGVERVARDRLVRLGQQVGTCAELVTRRRTSLLSPRAYVRDRYAQGRALALDDRRAITRLVRDDVRSFTAQPTTHVAEFRRVRWLLIAGALARWAGAVRQSLVVSPRTTGQS